MAIIMTLGVAAQEYGKADCVCVCQCIPAVTARSTVAMRLRASIGF